MSEPKGPKLSVRFNVGRLKQARLDCDLTHEKMTGKGLSLSTVRRAERGEAVSLESAAAIHAVLNKQPGELLLDRNQDDAEAKLKFSSKVIASYIFDNLSSIDGRLVLLQQVVEDDPQDEDLEENRQKTAPSMSQRIGNGYRQLIYQGKLKSINAFLITHGLKKNINEELLKNIWAFGKDDQPIRLFFDKQIAEVESATEKLVAALSDHGFVSERATPEMLISARGQVRVQLASLSVKSTHAVTLGIDALLHLEVDENEINSNLLTLKRFSLVVTRHSWTADKIYILKQCEKLAELVIKAKTKIIDELSGRVDRGKQQLKEIDSLFAINESDRWQDVVGKAKTLREFGRIPDAVRAFARYAELFSNSDPTAAQYAETAKAFTQSMARLNVYGGCYVFEVRLGGAEADAGLRVGDIVVEFDGKKTPGMMELSELYTNCTSTHASIATLRRDSITGEFERIEMSLKIATIFRGIMDI